MGLTIIQVINFNTQHLCTSNFCT